MKFNNLQDALYQMTETNIDIFKIKPKIIIYHCIHPIVTNYVSCSETL